MGAGKEQTVDEAVAKYRRRMSNLIVLMGNTFGYDIDLVENKLFLRSKYAFDEDDVITVLLDSAKGGVVLEGSDFVNRWRKEKEIYLEKGKSLGAFLAAITLGLFEQSTFQ
jgi:hypothetical protein